MIPLEIYTLIKMFEIQIGNKSFSLTNTENVPDLVSFINNYIFYTHNHDSVHILSDNIVYVYEINRIDTYKEIAKILSKLLDIEIHVCRNCYDFTFYHTLCNECRNTHYISAY